MYYIYKITNLINNKIYIGLTNNFNHRVLQHKSAAKTGKYNYPLYNSINKYGENNFRFEIIDKTLSKDEIVEKEIYWIKFYDSQNESIGYNLRGGGEIPYHTNLSIKKQQKNSYSGGKRKNNSKTQYKNVTANHRAILSVYGEKKDFGTFRTYIEAAWKVDCATRLYLSELKNPYLNFKNGKTDELIKEQLATKKMLETIKYVFYDIKFGGCFKNKYSVRGKDLNTNKVFYIAYDKDKSECEKKLLEFVYKNKAIKKARGSLSTMQREFELLHGSIHGLYTEEELNESIKNELGKFE